MSASMIPERLNDLEKIDPIQIGKILSEGKAVTIQFSKPPYERGLLADIDSLCVDHGDKVEVRFYGHYSTIFDASCLEFVPNVQSLYVDCLSRINSVEQLFILRHLRVLSLGIHELDRPNILSDLKIENLTKLSLIETKKANIDLSPLARCKKLQHLHLSSHINGFSVLKELDALESLNLASIPKRQTLEVVGNMPKLSRFRLILGGRPNIDEVSHPTLKELEVVRVLGLSSLGDLSRFPAMQKLRVEDQIRLTSLDTDRLSSELRQLALWNCKNLEFTKSLSHLTKLEDLGIGGILIDFDALLKSPLPPALQTIRFGTGKRKTYELYRARLDALGYGEFTKQKTSPV